MERPERIESRFLVPLRGDKSLGLGRLQSADKWNWLQNQLNIMFGGYSSLKTIVAGEWIDPQTSQTVYDESREYRVDINASRLPVMKDFLGEVAEVFQQQCIRFVCKGGVYYVKRRGLK